MGTSISWRRATGTRTMSVKFNPPGLSFLRLFGCLLTSVSVLCAQTPQTPKPQDEVVRVFTDLVQTDVMVFDKQGRFVNGLTKDNFQLKIDGKAKEIQAFDLVKAGSDEETQLAAARGGNIVSGKTVVPLDLSLIHISEPTRLLSISYAV